MTMSGCTFLSFVTRHFVSPEARIGNSAKNAFHSNPTNTVFDAKHLIGRKMDDPETQRNIKHLSASHFN
jgi:molecular chaperone DnaK (HSP70)